jgi:hypothetical protein
VADPVVSTITAETQAAVRAMVADARAAASAITAEAQRSAVSAIGSIHQSVTGAVADMRQSVTSAVSDTVHQIGSDFAAHVNTEITTMTADFKQSHPSVVQATTDVVGYVDAVSTTATAVQQMGANVKGAAGTLKEVPAAVRDMRGAIRETVSEAVKLGTSLTGQVQRGFSQLRQGAAGAAGEIGRFATAARGAAAAAASTARNLAQLAIGYARAAVQATITAARTVAMAVAQRVVAVATRLWAAMQALLNIAMRLNPLGLIITGITLLVGLFVLAYQRSATFRAIVQGALHGVQIAIGWVVDAARAVFNWIRANWPLLLGIITGPIGFAVLMIVRHWDQIKAGVGAVKDFIVGVWNSVMGFFGGLPGRLTAIANQMWEGFKSAVRGAINFLIDAWNRLDFGIHIHVPDWVPIVGGKGFDVDDIIPDIPRLAEGGLIPRRPGGVLALLGEGREDELVVPLSRVAGLGPARARQATVNVYPRATQSEYEIGRVVARELAWAAKH